MISASLVIVEGTPYLMKSARKHFEKRNIHNVGILLFKMPMFSFLLFTMIPSWYPLGIMVTFFKNKIEIIDFYAG